MAEVEAEASSSSGAKGGSKKKFEVKKWNAVALWAWGTKILYGPPQLLIF